MHFLLPFIHVCCDQLLTTSAKEGITHYNLVLHINIVSTNNKKKLSPPITYTLLLSNLSIYNGASGLSIIMSSLSKTLLKHWLVQFTISSLTGVVGTSVYEWITDVSDRLPASTCHLTSVSIWVNYWCIWQVTCKYMSCN